MHTLSSRLCLTGDIIADRPPGLRGADAAGILAVRPEEMADALRPHLSDVDASALGDVHAWLRDRLV